MMIYWILIATTLCSIYDNQTEFYKDRSYELKDTITTSYILKSVIEFDKLYPDILFPNPYSIITPMYDTKLEMFNGDLDFSSIIDGSSNYNDFIISYADLIIQNTNTSDVGYIIPISYIQKILTISQFDSVYNPTIMFLNKMNEVFKLKYPKYEIQYTGTNLRKYYFLIDYNILGYTEKNITLQKRGDDNPIDIKVLNNGLKEISDKINIAFKAVPITTITVSSTILLGATFRTMRGQIPFSIIKTITMSSFKSVVTLSENPAKAIFTLNKNLMSVIESKANSVHNLQEMSKLVSKISPDQNKVKELLTKMSINTLKTVLQNNNYDISKFDYIINDQNSDLNFQQKLDGFLSLSNSDMTDFAQRIDTKIDNAGDLEQISQSFTTFDAQNINIDSNPFTNLKAPTTKIGNRLTGLKSFSKDLNRITGQMVRDVNLILPSDKQITYKDDTTDTEILEKVVNARDAIISTSDQIEYQSVTDTGSAEIASIISKVAESDPASLTKDMISMSNVKSGSFLNRLSSTARLRLRDYASRARLGSKPNPSIRNNKQSKP
jgi:hypothetical protein